MTGFSNVDEVLDFAIANEQEAQRLYQQLADGAAHGGSKDLFLSFVAEEKRHEEKLRAVKSGGKLLQARAKVLDLKISDYLVDVEATPGMDFQDALIVAMKREKAAFVLYNDLANAVADAELAEMFRGLAQEEAKHKLFFELQYDEWILKNN